MPPATVAYMVWAMKKLIAGNWKMNGNLAEAVALAQGIAPVAGVDFCVCPPFVHLGAVRGVLPPHLALGAQDCSERANGAYTGDVSAAMLADLGCRYVIIGHSERRQYHGETDILVKAKAEAAISTGLTVILCVGETDAQRVAGQADIVVAAQLRDGLPANAGSDTLVIAYEPVWAIGTGKVPEIQDVRAMHALIRRVLKEKLDNSAMVRILYGGSVKPDNAGALLTVENVDGALVGGASLKADTFAAIAKAVANA